eukprot:TRINITY_DN2827_c0_g1_i1.p1 TRINITY_DN2827_c0_g1~~TRINITY_DN2827_c0_g1_i1.p1  ORF type:complete len:424 (-),score=92.67 TRINITY_DN2827_c0_g1_i1:241-1512(-)
MHSAVVSGESKDLLLAENHQRLSVDSSLKTAHSFVQDVYILFQVTETLEALLQNVTDDFHSKQISDLTSTSKTLELETKDHREKWLSDAKALENEMVPLQKEIEQIKLHNLTLQKQLDAVAVDVRSLVDNETNHLLRQKADLKSKDLSSMDKRVIWTVVSFLERRDLCAVIQTCRRWHDAFDRGYCWQILCVRLVRRIEKDTRSAAPKTDAPITVTVTLNNPVSSKKDILTKQKVFEKCLEYLRAKVAQAESEREDCFMKEKAASVVHKFLVEQLQRQRAEIGKAMLDLWHFEMDAEKIVEEKKAIVKQVSDLEAELANADKVREKLIQDTQSTLRVIEGKIQMIRDINAVMPRSKADKERELLDEKIQQLKAKKKILIRTIKQLRKELEETTQSRNRYAEEVGKLKEQLHKIKEKVSHQSST